MMTLDVSPEAWDNMIFAAERELNNLHHSGSVDSWKRDREDQQLIANAIHAALRVLMIKVKRREEG